MFVDALLSINGLLWRTSTVLVWLDRNTLLLALAFELAYGLVNVYNCDGVAFLSVYIVSIIFISSSVRL
jgi:hypothetical protein